MFLTAVSTIYAELLLKPNNHTTSFFFLFIFQSDIYLCYQITLLVAFHTTDSQTTLMLADVTRPLFQELSSVSWWFLEDISTHFGASVAALTFKQDGKKRG